MENLKITIECLEDLIAFHAERIDGYDALLSRLSAEDECLATLFRAFIKQSHNMRDELIRAEAMWNMDEGQLRRSGRFGLAWSVVKAVFSSNMPTYPLDKCKSGENAFLIAYHSVEGTDGLHPAIRLLVNRQKREVIEAREWILHFEGVRKAPIQQLAAVS
jgi:hypothetical protein